MLKNVSVQYLETSLTKVQGKYYQVILNVVEESVMSQCFLYQRKYFCLATVRYSFVDYISANTTKTFQMY